MNLRPVSNVRPPLLCSSIPGLHGPDGGRQSLISGTQDPVKDGRRYIRCPGDVHLETIPSGPRSCRARRRVRNFNRVRRGRNARTPAVLHDDIDRLMHPRRPVLPASLLRADRHRRQWRHLHLQWRPHSSALASHRKRRRRPGRRLGRRLWRRLGHSPAELDDWQLPLHPSPPPPHLAQQLE